MRSLTAKLDAEASHRRTRASEHLISRHAAHRHEGDGMPGRRVALIWVFGQLQAAIDITKPEGRRT